MKRTCDAGSAKTYTDRSGLQLVCSKESSMKTESSKESKASSMNPILKEILSWVEVFVVHTSQWCGSIFLAAGDGEHGHGCG